MEQFSSFVQHQPFQLSLLYSEFQLSLLPTMAKRLQEQKKGDRVAAKSKPTTMNLTSTVSTSSSSVNHPIVSKSRGILKASTRACDARARRNSKPDAASSSQGRLKDAYVGGLLVGVTGRLVATVKSLESWEFSESESWSDHEKKLSGKPGAESSMLPSPLCAEVSGKLDAESVQKRESDTQKTQAYHSQREGSMSISSRDLEATGKPIATKSSGYSEMSKAANTKWQHNFHLSPASVLPHEESLFVRTVNLRPKSNGWLEWPRREHGHMVNILECHTPSCIWIIYCLPRISS